MESFYGHVLWVDLTRGSLETTDVDRAVLRKYLGGYGLGMYYLLKHLPPGCDPLSPDNVMVVANGLLTGTGAPCTPRYVICAKSPLTHALARSEAGGFWGAELKKCGYDAIVLTGKAKTPVYLWISDGAAEIRDADGIWGLTTGESEDRIRESVGDDKARVLVIGPGGENLVRYAGICSDLSHFSGRNGLGAVMGSKNLKAIAVRGKGQVNVNDRAKLVEITRRIGQLAKEHPLSSLLHDRGTSPGVDVNNAAGCLPTRNWSTGVFEGAADIGSDRLTYDYLVDRGGCHVCSIRCKRVVELNDPELKVERRYGGPEYETLVSLGSNCGISNLKVVLKANELCNKYAIDTISAGMVISFAMACYEKGLITRAETGGLDLCFGNDEALLAVIDQIAYRRGIGRLLAEGSELAAKEIGRGAEQFVMTVKGQEVPMHDPRVKTGLGLQFALSPNGADHWFAQHDPFFVSEDSYGTKALAPLGIAAPVPALDLGPDKVRLVLYTSFLNALYDSLGACVFGVVARGIVPLDDLVELVRAVTGWHTSLWELVKSGERVNTMARLFNLREGIGREQDRLPETFFRPFVGGPLDGKNALDKRAFDQAIQAYYSMAGWDPETGIPTDGKIHELGLDEFVTTTGR